jgi:hypothetical protein
MFGANNSSRSAGKRKGKRKFAETSDDVNYLDIFNKLKPVFRQTFDLPQFSMNLLAALFLDADKYRFVDIYTRRRPITDLDGNRLPGTAPYNFDPAGEADQPPLMADSY